MLQFWCVLPKSLSLYFKSKGWIHVRKTFAKELKTLPSHMTVTLIDVRGKKVIVYNFFSKYIIMQL